MTGQTGIPSYVRSSALSADALKSWRIFPGEPGQIGMVRRWVRDLLPPCDALDDVVLIASELGTNAVCHTASGRGGQFVVEIAWAAEVVRVAVADEGGPSEPRLIEAPDGEGGRGLQAVHGLSACTGFTGDGNGRLIWAEVQWATRGGPPPQDAGWNPAGAAALETLRARFPDVPAWFGQATGQWWAMVTIDGEHRLIGATSPLELLTLLAAAWDPRSSPDRWELGPIRAPAWQARFASATEAV